MILFLLLGLALGGFWARGAILTQARRLWPGARKWRGGRWRNWKPGAATLAVLSVFAAMVLCLRAAWLEALALFALGAGLAYAARRRPSARAPVPASAGMSRADAAAILGVAQDATAEEVQAAYRRLARRTHPDSGGTTGLAAQLNAARDAMRRS